MIERRTFVAAAAATGSALAIKSIEADQRPLGDFPNWRYPDPRVEALDKKFKCKVGNTAIEWTATGPRWAEGSVYFRDGGYLWWSDIPNNRIMRWLEDDGHPGVYRQPSNDTNGNTRDPQGRLVGCEQDAQRATRTEHDGTITVPIDGASAAKNAIACVSVPRSMRSTSRPRAPCCRSGAQQEKKRQV